MDNVLLLLKYITAPDTTLLERIRMSGFLLLAAPGLLWVELAGIFFLVKVGGEANPR